MNDYGTGVPVSMSVSAGSGVLIFEIFRGPRVAFAERRGRHEEIMVGRPGWTGREGVGCAGIRTACYLSRSVRYMSLS